MSTSTTRFFHLVALFILSIGITGLGSSGAMARGTTPSLRETQGIQAELPARAPRGLSVYQRNRLSSYLDGAAIAPIDSLRLIVLRVAYADSIPGFLPDSLYFASELTHLTEYFRGASLGKTEVIWTLSAKVYKLPKESNYYGRDLFEDERVVELVTTAVRLADPDVDFSAYDHVFTIHAGPGQETDVAGDSRNTQVWSSFYDAGDIAIARADSSTSLIPTADTKDGQPFYVDNFSIVGELASQDGRTIGSLGIWVYQVGNRVGMLPLFDSTPGVPDSQGVGNFCVMAYGLFNALGFIPSFPCVFNRMIVGWVDPVLIDVSELPANGRSFRLTDINTGSDADTVCIRIPITENEYFLVTNRAHDSNFDSLFTFVDNDSDLIPGPDDSLDGAEFDFFLTDLTNPIDVRFEPAYGRNVARQHTGSGVYVWHIDEQRIRNAVSAGFLPNDFVDAKGVDLEEADGVQDLDGRGFVEFALGSHWDSFRSGDRNQNSFTPDTEPSSASNTGIDSRVIIKDISIPGHDMTLTLRGGAAVYDETRTRWEAAVSRQTATPVQFDGVGVLEIVTLAPEGVFVFAPDGSEYNDGDADPTTIDPFIPMNTVSWTGPAAFADLDDSGAAELVGTTTDGIVYVWKGTGAEFFDGDNDAGTNGILFSGAPIVTPAMIIDVGETSTPELVFVQTVGDSLQARVIRTDGTTFMTTALVPGQSATALAVVHPVSDDIGVAIISHDTTSSQVWVNYVPIAGSTGPWSWSFDASAGAIPSAPAASDIDGDGRDEIVFTVSDGRLYIVQSESGERSATRLRSLSPSGPALGDIDLDGTMEIALWDADYLYVLGTNGAPETDWPKRLTPLDLDEDLPRILERNSESPIIADIDGNGSVDILFPVQDGSFYAFSGDGRPVAGFPRVGTSNAAATPALAALQGGTGELSLVTLGAYPSLRRVDAVVDSFATVVEAVISIQTLPGSDAFSRRFWSQFQGGLARTGRAMPSVPLLSRSGTFREETFMVYPNPVRGDIVHARVVLDNAAQVRLEIYNLEGERTFSQLFDANPSGLIDTAFDEMIEIGNLVSGLYFMRLSIRGESLVKPFAVRR